MKARRAGRFAAFPAAARRRTAATTTVDGQR